MLHDLGNIWTFDKRPWELPPDPPYCLNVPDRFSICAFSSHIRHYTQVLGPSVSKDKKLLKLESVP